MIDGGSHHWRQLCQIALLETDPEELLIRIAHARNVILDRIEDCHSKSNGEQAALREALLTLDNLRRISGA